MYKAILAPYNKIEITSNDSFINAKKYEINNNLRTITIITQLILDN